MRKKETICYILKKIVLFLVSIFLLSVIVFYIARLAPGDPLVSYYGERVEKMSPEEHAWAEEKLGLNEPIAVQYVKWLGNALHGNFGISYKYKMDVLEVIAGRVVNTALKSQQFCMDTKYALRCFNVLRTLSMLDFR